MRRAIFFVSLAWLCAEAVLAQSDARGVIEKLDSLVTIPVQEWKCQTASVQGGERPDLDDGEWRITYPDAREPRRPNWYRATVTLPGSQGGYLLTGGKAELRLLIGGEAMVYVNGVLRARPADEPAFIPLSEHIQGGEKFVVAIELVPEMISDAGLRNAELRISPPPSRPDVYELARSLELIEVFANSQIGAQYRPLLEAAIQKIDFQALESGDQQRFDLSLRAAGELLQPLGSELKRRTVRLIGQSHIDMAWLWPWTETVEVVRRTFRTALQLMKRNPEFIFTQSQAAAYAWVEEKYPALFEEIKQRVKEGRWEIVGGMWVEPDLNMPDGESLVRQILFGKRYFKQKFGVDVRTGWNPDTFGYSWQLPQILKKSGIDYFLTVKLHNNDTTKFPHRIFWWQSPDGSRVLTYLPNRLGADVDPPEIARQLVDITQASNTQEIIYLYGVGDHGGGPTQRNIDAARRLQQLNLFPNLQFGPVEPFFDALVKRSEEYRIPVWNDELYFEYHRGVFASQAKTKRNNRKCEVLLVNAEKFSSLAQLFGHQYRQADLNEAWKLVLFNQFHDILPGSSIAPVYVDADRDYRQVGYLGRDVRDESLSALATRIRTAGPGMALVVFNPLTWERTEVVEAEVRFPNPAPDFSVVDELGRPVLQQAIELSQRPSRARFLFLAERVPSLGYKTFHVVPRYTRMRGRRARPMGSLKADTKALTLENEFLSVKVGPESGLIERLYDKVNRREVWAPSRAGNLLQTFVDKPKDWDAWNIDADFENTKWDLDRADSVEVLESGPVRSTIRVTKHFQNSRFVQDIVMYPKVARVDCAMEVDWREKHILLKVAFPLSVSSRHATYEIPFGAIRRPTTRETPAEKAKFEVPALRWADLSDETYGVSILNESKYGYDTKDNVIRLTLLRSPAWPDPHADEGVHRFTYSIYPHAGDWERGETARRAYELNFPLIVKAERNHSGELPATHSFLSIDSPTVFLAAMKKAEDDERTVLRVYKLGGRAEQVILTLPKAAAEAFEADLMESRPTPLAVANNQIQIELKPYEIKTLLVRFR